MTIFLSCQDMINLVSSTWLFISSCRFYPVKTRKSSWREQNHPGEKKSRPDNIKIRSDELKVVLARKIVMTRWNQHPLASVYVHVCLCACVFHLNDVHKKLKHKNVRVWRRFFTKSNPIILNTFDIGLNMLSPDSLSRFSTNIFYRGVLSFASCMLVPIWKSILKW